MKMSLQQTQMYKLIHLSMVFVLLLGAFNLQPVASAHAAGSTIYVRAGNVGGNNGTSWANAFTDLQSAIAAAGSSDQIWVAAGTYYPGAVPYATFALKNGVAIYGGFAGTETQLSQRDPKANVTILSGEIGSSSSITDNIYHVVTGSNTNNTAVLDGFTITAGNAVGVAPVGGGGMLIQNGSPSLSNLMISNNRASYGGGLFNYPNASPTLNNVTFSGNRADRGGGMYNNSNSSPVLTNVTFTGNRATLRGGGMSVSNGAPQLTNVTFSDNVSNVYGGALHTVFSGNPVLKNVTMGGNSATSGGGLYVEGGNPVITNSIIYSNSADQIIVQTGAATVSNSVVQGGFAGGTNIIDQNPFLGTLENNGGYTQTMALGIGSSAINQLDPALCPALDQRGVSRPQGALCDIGAYEVDYTPPTITNVSSDNEDGLYHFADTVTVTVTFTEAVNVTGLPQLTLETGVNDRNASYSGGNGTNTLSFTYTVQADDSSPDLDYVSTTALTLNGGTIKDISGNNAVLTLPAPTQPGSLSANKDLVIEGGDPVAVSLLRQSPTAEFTSADTLVFRIAFSEEVVNVDANDFLITGTTTATITNVAAVDATHYDLTVSGGDLPDFNGVVGLDLNSSDIQDLAGHALVAGPPLTNESYTVDNIVPGVTSINRLDADPTSASSVAFALTFTEPVLNVDAMDFVLSTTGDFSGAGITGITGSGANYVVHVDTWYGIGTIRLDLMDNNSIQDRASNPLGGPTMEDGSFTTGQTYTINRTATNRIAIGGVVKGSYGIPSSRTMVTSYAGVQTGPVKVVSTNTNTFFTSQRVIAGTSFNEVMGYPTNQLTTEYWFPIYDNITMQTWILVGNPSTTTAKVDVYVGGVRKSSHSIPPGGRVMPRYKDLQNGPVRVVSTNGVKIFASERAVFNNSFNEVMGYPKDQFTTEYWFPYYDNVSMQAWILVGNPSASAAKVYIYVGSQKFGPYTVPAGGRVMPRYNIPANGPVRVVSTNGVKIFTSERSLYGDSFNEVMGYPKNQFATEYYYPWYDNISMSTWILVGNPSTSSPLNVDIYIGGVKQGSKVINPGGRLMQRYNLNAGPVRVVSTNGVKFFSSERAIYSTSFNEVMGYPGDKLSTEYWFTWYDSLTMSTNILIGRP